MSLTLKYVLSLTIVLIVRLYGVMKAHKPEKCYRMQAIVSAIGTLLNGISQYFVELIQPTLNKSKYKIINSSSFVNEPKN